MYKSGGKNVVNNYTPLSTIKSVVKFSKWVFLGVQENTLHGKLVLSLQKKYFLVLIPIYHCTITFTKPCKKFVGAFTRSTAKKVLRNGAGNVYTMRRNMVRAGVARLYTTIQRRKSILTNSDRCSISRIRNLK